jgi:hypothetical protein
MAMLAANIVNLQPEICGTCNVIISLFMPIRVFIPKNIIFGTGTNGVDYSISGTGCWAGQFVFPTDAMRSVIISLVEEVVLSETGESVSIETTEIEFDYDTCHTIQGNRVNLFLKKVKLHC